MFCLGLFFLHSLKSYPDLAELSKVFICQIFFEKKEKGNVLK